MRQLRIEPLNLIEELHPQLPKTLVFALAFDCSSPIRYRKRVAALHQQDDMTTPVIKESCYALASKKKRQETGRPRELLCPVGFMC